MNKCEMLMTAFFAWARSEFTEEEIAELSDDELFARAAWHLFGLRPEQAIAVERGDWKYDE